MNVLRGVKITILPVLHIGFNVLFNYGKKSLKTTDLNFRASTWIPVMPGEGEEVLVKIKGSDGF